MDEFLRLVGIPFQILTPTREKALLCSDVDERVPYELTLIILENKFEILIGAELVLMSYIKLAIFS